MLREVERVVRARRHREGPFSPEDTLAALRIVARRLYCIMHRDTGRAPGKDTLVEAVWKWARGDVVPGDMPEASVATVLAAVISALKMTPRNDTAEAAGKALKLTYAERTRLRIKTLWACDVDPADRQRLYLERKRERDRERSRAKRAAKGAKPRVFLGTAKQAEAEGVSVSTIKRWRRAARAALTPSNVTTFPGVNPNVAHFAEAPCGGGDCTPTSDAPKLTAEAPVNPNVADTLKTAPSQGKNSWSREVVTRVGVCMRARGAPTQRLPTDARSTAGPPAVPANVVAIDRERRERKARWLERHAERVAS
jgi:hypothetical protein